MKVQYSCDVLNELSCLPTLYLFDVLAPALLVRTRWPPRLAFFGTTLSVNVVQLCKFQKFEQKICKRKDRLGIPFLSSIYWALWWCSPMSILKAIPTLNLPHSFGSRFVSLVVQAARNSIFFFAFQLLSWTKAARPWSQDPHEATRACCKDHRGVRP